MKKEYVKPQTQVYQLRVQQPLLAGSSTMSFSNDDWDDDWEND